MNFKPFKNKILSLAITLIILFYNMTIFAMTIDDKKGERDNTPPTASFDALAKQKLDIIVVTDYTGEKLARLQSTLNDFKSANVGKYDVRTQVNSNIAKFDMGIQKGKYNKSVYGIVGRSKFSGQYQLSWYGLEPVTIPHSNEDFNICINPIYREPGEPPPQNIPAQIPTGVTYTTSTRNTGSTTRYFDIYTPYGPITYTPYQLGWDDEIPQKSCTWFQKGWNSSSGWGDYYNTLTPHPFQFTFDPYISFYGYEATACTNSVRAWNLSSTDFSARVGSKAFYLVAVDGTSTDFYSTSIYNQDNINNYKWGNLRNDNLGKAVQDSKGIVLASVDNSSLETNLGNTRTEVRWRGTGRYDYNDDEIFESYNVYVNDTYKIEYSDNSKLQDLSLNQLITQKSSDYRIFDNTQMDGTGLINRINSFLSIPSTKIDLVIGTDKGRDYANNFINTVKNAVGSSIDVKGYIADNNNAVNVTGLSKKQFKDDLILNPFNSPYDPESFILRVGDNNNNTWYNLGPLKLSTTINTTGTVVAYNARDVSSSYIGYGSSGMEYMRYVLNGDGTLYINSGQPYNYGSYFQRLDSSPYPAANMRGYETLWYKFNCPEPIKKVRTFNCNSGPFNYTAFLVLTDYNNVYALYRDTGGNYTLKYELLGNSAQDIFTDGAGAYFIDYSGNLHSFYSYYEYDSDGNAIAKRRFNGILRSGVKQIKQNYQNRYILTTDNTLYSLSSYIYTGVPIATDVKNLDWYFTTYNDGPYVYTTTQNRSIYHEYKEVDTDSYDNPIYGYVNRELSSSWDVDKYTGIYGGYIGYGFNSYSFTKKSLDGSIQDDKYADIYSFQTLNSTGLTFMLNNDGSVYISYYDPYPYDKMRNIRLASNVESNIWRTKYFNIYSLNNGVIKASTLRSDADKIFVYISDSTNLNTGMGFWSYFPWGQLNQDVINYFQNNKYAIYVIGPKSAFNVRFQPPYTDGYYQERTIGNLYSADIRDSLRFDNADQFAAFIGPKYAIGQVEDPNAIYLVQGEDSLSYSTVYSDFENDPQNSLRWMFTHDPYVFENSQGLNPLAGQWIYDINGNYMQVGKYIVQCQAQDRPTDDTRFTNYWKWGDKSNSKTVYFHRRPTADFKIYLNKSGSGFITSIEDNSYDLDRISYTYHGIIQWKWKYRIKGSSDWIYGKIPYYVDKGVYEVSLEVLDRQGTWSKPKVTLVDTTVNLTPTIDAAPTSTYGWVNYDFPVTITADDNGENDFNRLTYTNSGSADEPGWIDATAYQKVVPITCTAEGIWYLHMRVFDNAGNTFYRYRGPYLIDKTPPGGTAAPYSAGWTNQDVTVTFSPWDNLSGVSSWRYIASSNNGASWGAWSGYTLGAAPAAVAFNYEGIHKLLAEVTDNAGNVSYVTTGNYLIDKTAPVITPDMNGPLEVFDSVTVNLTVSDNLSGVEETKYMFSQSMDKPSSGWATTTAANFPASINQEGTWFLHVESTDNAGNVSYSIIGSFKVNIVRIYDLTVTLINDITWRDYYYEGSAYNQGGNPTKFARKSNTDIKAFQMPVNNYNSAKIIDFSRDGIDSGCEVNFYLRSYGNPENVAVIAYYTTNNGDKSVRIQPISGINELWEYTFVIPSDCKPGTFISFDIEAVKNGNVYGTDRWVESWLPLNTDRKIFYITGNVMDRLKFNQSH